jgi:hypothetical protein
MPQSLHDRLQQQDMRISDDAAAAALNTPDNALPLIYVDASLLHIKNIFRITGELAGIKDASERHETASTRLAAIAAVDLFQPDPEAQELGWGDHPAIPLRVAAILDTLRSAGLVSQSTQDAIMATAQRHQSWAEANLGRPVTLHEVSIAR